MIEYVDQMWKRHMNEPIYEKNKQKIQMKHDYTPSNIYRFWEIYETLAQIKFLILYLKYS